MMTATEELEFHVRNYEAKYPDENSPMHYLVGRTAEELLAAFKLAKGKRLQSVHFVIKKRKKKQYAEEAQETQEAPFEQAAA
jgi:hypothetical protein